MSENDEDFVEVIKRGLDQDKIKDKWKGEFSGRQKFSERVEKRIAKGSSLGNRIAVLCIPRVMQAMAVLFFEILDPAASMPRIKVKNPDQWPITIAEEPAGGPLRENMEDREELRTPMAGGGRGVEEVDRLIAEFATGIERGATSTTDQWAKFQKAFDYHPNIKALTKDAINQKFKNNEEFQNWCVSHNLAPLSEIANRTGIKLEDLTSQRHLADANRNIHREILACCNEGHVSQAQHEYCTANKIGEGNAQYVRGLPLFLFMIKGNERDSLYMTAIHSCIVHRMPKKPGHKDMLKNAQDISRKVNLMMQLETGTTPEKRANEMKIYLLLQDFDRHGETKWISRRLRENPTWEFRQVYDWIASIDPKKDLTKATGKEHPKNVREANFAKGNPKPFAYKSKPTGFSGAKGNSKPTVTCFNCNKQGHYRRECPDLKDKPKWIPERYKKPKPHPSMGKHAEGNLLIREVNYAEGKIYHSEAVSSDPNPSCCLLAACGRAGALHGQFGCFIWPLVLAMLLVRCGGYMVAICNSHFKVIYNAAHDSDHSFVVLVPLGLIWLYLAIAPRCTRAINNKPVFCFQHNQYKPRRRGKNVPAPRRANPGARINGSRRGSRSRRATPDLNRCDLRFGSGVPLGTFQTTAGELIPSHDPAKGNAPGSKPASTFATPNPASRRANPDAWVTGRDGFAFMLSTQKPSEDLTFTHCIWDSGASMHTIRTEDISITDTILTKDRRRLTVYGVFGDRMNESTKWGKRRIGKFVLPQVAISDQFARGLISHSEFCKDNPGYSIVTDEKAVYVIESTRLADLSKIKVGVAQGGVYHEIIPERQ